MQRAHDILGLDNKDTTPLLRWKLKVYCDWVQYIIYTKDVEQLLSTQSSRMRLAYLGSWLCYLETVSGYIRIAQGQDQ